MRAGLATSVFVSSLAAAVIAGCDGGDGSQPGDTAEVEVDIGPDGDVEVTPDIVNGCPVFPGDPSFDDHTAGSFSSASCLLAYAGEFTRDPAAIKYVIADINRGAPADVPVFFYDNDFYRLHDEWYWFRLLNGQPIPGLAEPQPVDLSFDSIAAVYAAFSGQTELPLDLRFLDTGTGFEGRLYSPRYYALAGFNEPLSERFFGPGTLVHYGPDPRRVVPEEIWAFELEFPDRPSIEVLERTFAILEAKLPPEIAAQLRWVARSESQEARALQLRQLGHPLGPRTLTYDDLIVDGDVEVYNEGIAAGTVHLLEADFNPSLVRAEDIAVLARVPDDIPPTRAILSNVPQTALAHVNLLAKARGTPNAYVGGIMSWGQLGEWAWNKQRVIMEATEELGVRWQPITSEQYDGYVSRLRPPARHVSQVPDLGAQPLAVSLAEGGIAEMRALVPLIGGKSAGFLSFSEVPSMSIPDTPLAITIRPFVEHQTDLLPHIEAALADIGFQQDARLRFAVLEGEQALLALEGDDPATLAFLASVHAQHQDDAIHAILAAGGVRQMIIDKPMAYETLRDLRAMLEEHFVLLDRSQGLRFRSSSTAEDVPGFNGAGLYQSHTGFLYPSALSDPGDRARTVEHAIKRTWASYWGYQAFEERRVGRVDHLEGNMGVAVHARFDDPLERANAVATFWVSDYTDPPVRRLVINVQQGALAVTNPGGTLELPEIDEVVPSPGDGAPPVIMRQQRSTLAEPDEWLLSDAELVAIYEQADQHSERWLAHQGAELPRSERPQTLVLDYELKMMKPGWPKLASGEERPARIVWKQARVLDQVAKIGAETPDPWLGGGFPLARYLPGDLRTVAKSLIAERCESEWVDLRVYRVATEASQRELFPFSERPFIYKVAVDFKKTPPGMSASLESWLLQWTNLVDRRWTTNGTTVTFNTAIAETLGIDGFELTSAGGGSFRVWRGDSELEASCGRRELRQPYQSAQDYLRSLMPR